MTDHTQDEKIMDDAPETPGVAPAEPVADGEAAAAAAAPDARVEELNDRLLRTLAEMENLRQRTRREVEEAQRYAVTGFARELLEISDNLSRALAAVPPEARDKDPFLENLIAGIEMTERALLAVFERHQVRKVLPERGARFDHKLHQAMFEVPTEELPPGTIAEVLTPGYVIADRLLRPAMVGVAKAPPQGAPAANDRGEGRQGWGNAGA
jgi:molecular chaperone GrpE